MFHYFQSALLTRTQILNSEAAPSQFLSGANSSNADLQQRRQLAAELQRLPEPLREQPGVVRIPVTQPSAQQHAPNTQPHRQHG